MDNFIEFITNRHNINLKTELKLYKAEQEKIKIGCKHSDVFILDCPLVNSNYIHVRHSSNCKTCYNIKCSDCGSKFQCKSCYDDTKKKITILKTDYIEVVIVMINILLRQMNIKTENIKKIL